jgi:hypothetical protein
MPMPVYIPPLLAPATLSSPLPPSLSSLIPFVSSLNSYILFIPPSVSLPTMPQTLLLTVPFLYITPMPSPSSPLSRLSRLLSPPYVASAGPIAFAPPLVMATVYNY